MILPKLLQNAHCCSLPRLSGPDIAPPEVLNTNCNCPSEYGVHVGAVEPNAAAKSTFGSPVRTNDTTVATYNDRSGASSAGLGKLSGNSAIAFSPCTAGGTSSVTFSLGKYCPIRIGRMCSQEMLGRANNSDS